MSLKQKVEQFAPAQLSARVEGLEESDRQVLALLIEAARWLDPIYDRQAYADNPALREQLAKDPTPEGALRLSYFDIMRGPWDRQDEYRPFAVEKARPPGAGYYPEDLSREELEAYLAAHPEERELMESPMTIVRREKGKLVAVPYSVAYAEWLIPAAEKLREAAAITKNSSLKRFLEARADAFSSNDYFESDKAWMDLESIIEVTIGPYETYEDTLLGLKTAFEAFVTVSDPEASGLLGRYKALLDDMEANLPIPEAARGRRGAESPIRVVDLVYSSGDARKSVQTLAFNLPNDERVREQKGSKKVLMRNIIKTKFDLILRPIGRRVLAARHLASLSSEAFFNAVLFHELSHALGPAHARVEGELVDLRKALGASYSPIEEAKADSMGAFNLVYLIGRGEVPEVREEEALVSYFAGLLRSVRFGVDSAHGRGAALQINRYLQAGAAQVDAATGRIEIDTGELKDAIESLVRDICLLQHEGDQKGVESLLERYGILSPEIEAAISGLSDIPVDIRPEYPLAQGS